MILDRPAWFLDFPKWQELRGGNGTGRKDSCVTVESSRQQYQQRQLKSQQHIQSLENLIDPSRGAGEEEARSTNSDSDPFEYDMSNRAQLPKGIENIRPHLETMDNVPLLVSLFTDSTPDTTKEMIDIMQVRLWSS